MQARENTSQERTSFAMLQLLYPEGCGYRVCVCVYFTVQYKMYLIILLW